jgi:hypothetical protein
MQPRTGKDLKKAVDPTKQEEIFFTMKVYATKSGGKLKTLKYSIDLHPPFESNTSSIAPFASPIVEGNMEIFQKIFKNVQDVFKYIANPLKNPVPKSKAQQQYKPDTFRENEQVALANAIEASKGAINHITYELNSPPFLSVGVVFNSTGNGDMKPPAATTE